MSRVLGLCSSSRPSERASVARTRITARKTWQRRVGKLEKVAITYEGLKFGYLACRIAVISNAIRIKMLTESVN